MQAITSLALAVFLRLAAAQTDSFPYNLPLCAHAYDNIRNTCMTLTNETCTCTDAYPGIQQSIVQYCNAVEATVTYQALNTYCAAAQACDTAHPSVAALPSCAESCARGILPQQCGGLDDDACTCANRGQLHACFTSSCDDADYEAADCTVNALCGTS